MRRQMRPERLHATALGGMVSGRIEVDAGLARRMHGRLRGLAGDVGIAAGGDRQVDRAGGRAGAPGDAPQRPVVAGGVDVQRHAPERMPDLLAAHEAAFAHFGGRCEFLLYDRMRTVVLGAGKAGGAMAAAVDALWPADAPIRLVAGERPTA